MPGALEEGGIDNVGLLEVVDDFLQSFVSPLRKSFSPSQSS